MKAEDLVLDELLTCSDGVLSLHGRRLILHDTRAMAQFRHDLVDSVGADRAQRILTRFGHFWGQADAAAMKRIFEWDRLEDWLRALPRLQSLQGQAKAIITALDLDEAGHLTMELAWHGSAEAEEHLSELGRAPEPACWILTGYASGYASFCLGRPVFYIERECRAHGDRLCRATGRDDESWGAEIEPFRGCFEADDIKGKIDELTAELRQKTRQLARSRRRLREMGSPARPSLADVRSKAFEQVLQLAARVARFDSSLLITGESGVGKEVLARLIHGQSHRARGPFVPITCSALPETLLESELFGHRAGAFTGAVRDRKGLFEEARGGTIFLDEIGDVSLAMQVKLLRVLQEKTIVRLGENTPRPIDARVMAATHRDLEAAARAGAFRDDLLYRLRVIEVRVPPLRERPEDVLPLARHFARQFESRLRIPHIVLDASCLEHLQRHAWPGNVRELENVIERAAVLSEDGRIRIEHLPPALVEPGLGTATGGARTLAAVERTHIEAVLRETGGSPGRAARILGVSPSTLWRKAQAWRR